MNLGQRNKIITIYRMREINLIYLLDECRSLLLLIEFLRVNFIQLIKSLLHFLCDLCSVANTTGTTLILKELEFFSSLQVEVFP